MNISHHADRVAPSVELARDIVCARDILETFYATLCQRHGLSVIDPDTILHRDASESLNTADQMYTREILALPGISPVGEQLAYFYDRVLQGDWSTDLDRLTEIAIRPEMRRAICVLFVAGGAVAPATQLFTSAAIAIEAALGIFGLRRGLPFTHLVDDMHTLRQTYDATSRSFQPVVQV